MNVEQFKMRVMKRNNRIFTALMILIMGMMIFAGCEKNTEDRRVTYVVEGLIRDFNVGVMDEEGTIKFFDKVDTNKWSYSFIGKSGDPFYIYLRYRDPVTLPAGFYVAVHVDGKAVHYTNNYDRNWGTNPDSSYPYHIIRQGIVPFK